METLLHISSMVTLIAGALVTIFIAVVVITFLIDRIINYGSGWKQIHTWHQSHLELHKRPRAVKKSLVDEAREEAKEYKAVLQMYIDAYANPAATAVVHVAAQDVIARFREDYVDPNRAAD